MRTVGDVMTFLAMSGSGARIGMEITSIQKLRIQPVYPVALSAFFAAAVVPTLLATAGRPFAASTALRFVATILVYAA